MVPLPGYAPPKSIPQEAVGQSWMMGRRRMSPALRPRPGLGKSGPQSGILRQQLDMGCRQNTVRHHELAWCRRGLARIVSGERDESGRPGAVCAWAASA